jgi:hypothetical protein
VYVLAGAVIALSNKNKQVDGGLVT